MRPRLHAIAADRVAYGAICLLVVSITWNGFRFAGGALADTFMVIGFASVAPLVIWERRPVPLPPWMAIAALGLFASAVVTMIFPPGVAVARTSQLIAAEMSPIPMLVPNRSDTSALVKFELALLVLPLLIATVATTARRCTRLLDLFALSAVVSGLVAILDYASVAHLAPVAISHHRSAGLAIHPNYLAFNEVMALPPALIWFGRSARWNVVALIGVPALLAGVFASGSRAATVAALIAVGATLVAIPRLRQRAGFLLPFVVGFVIVLLIFSDAGHEVLHQVRLNSGNATAQASNSQRAAIARVAVTQFHARPVEGVGFSVIEDAHNIYLQLLSAGGLIALASFAVYCAGLFGAARRALAVQRDAAIAGAMSILVWLVAGFVNNELIDKFIYVIPGVLVGMSWLAARKAAPAEVPRRSATRRQALPAAVGAP